MTINEPRIFKDDTAFNDKSIAWGGTPGWFYVEHRNNPFRVIYSNGEGGFFWGDRDFPGTVPVIWNTRSNAQRMARHMEGRVKIYPYRLK